LVGWLEFNVPFSTNTAISETIKSFIRRRLKVKSKDCRSALPTQYSHLVTELVLHPTLLVRKISAWQPRPERKSRDYAYRLMTETYTYGMRTGYVIFTNQATVSYHRMLPSQRNDGNQSYWQAAIV